MNPSYPVLWVIGLLAALLSMSGNTNASITFRSELAVETDRIIDVRLAAHCTEASLPQGSCLPVEQLLAGQNRLANFSGLFWLLGTMGLDGTEHVAIVGNASHRREFVAGVLFISGQSKIDVITQPVSTLLEASTNNAPGKQRSTTRSSIYTAHPRTNLLMLKPELIAALASAQPPALLDGRTEGEYWGSIIRAARGGHIPGALLEPSPKRFSTTPGVLPVAYSQDSAAGLAYLARLTARQIDTRLFLGGWVQWAWDARLPVDAETFPIVRTPVTSKSLDLAHPPVTLAKYFQNNRWALLMLAVMLFLVMSGTYWLGHTRRVSL